MERYELRYRTFNTPRLDETVFTTDATYTINETVTGLVVLSVAGENAARRGNFGNSYPRC